MSGVFISYRRADAQGWAGRLGAELGTAFGEVARFFDLASIPPGADFLQEIQHAMADAKVVLVLIGPHWLTLRDEQGRRRLDVPEDVVAAEVAQALQLAVPVIPVLLGGATMPAHADLPAALQPLQSRNAIELSDVRWDYDRERLFTAIEQSTPLKRRAAPLAAAAMTVSVGAGLDLQDAEVGRITGVRGAAPAAGRVEVLDQARLRNVKIADITGVDLGPPKP